MSKISKKALVSPELAELRARRTDILTAALRHRYAPVHDTRHLLYVNGRVPYGEPVRSTRKACRASAIRIIYDGMYRDPPLNLSGRSWQQQLYYRRLIPQIIDDLEAEGVIEYRPVNPQEAVAAPVGHQGIAA